MTTVYYVDGTTRRTRAGLAIDALHLARLAAVSPGAGWTRWARETMEAAVRA